MKKTSVISLALALCLLLSLLAGCGGTGTQTGSDNPPASAVSGAEASAAEAVPEQEPEAAAPAEAGSKQEPAEEPVEAEPVYEKVEVVLPITDGGETISMYLLLPPFITAMVERPNDLTVLGELEKRTGLTFDITPGNYIDGQTDVNLLIAGGTYPDIINHADLYAGGIDAAVNEEIIIDLKDHILNEMPNLLASLKAYDADVIKQITTDSGYIPYFPELYKDPYVDNFALEVRKDLMEENNLEIPETYEELHDVLAALHNATGMQLGFNKEGFEQTLLAGFNLKPAGNTGGFLVVDGEVRYPGVEDGMYEYLQMVRDWFAEGIIYSDFVSYESFMQNSALTAGNTLFGGGGANAQTMQEAQMNGIELMALPYPRKNPGDEIKVYGQGIVSRCAAWSVSTQCSDENLDLICQLVDYIFSDEGTLLFNYGVEDEGFRLNADGQPEWTELITEYPGGTTTAAMIYATGTPAEYLPGIYDSHKFDYGYDDAMREVEEMILTASTGEYDYPIGADNRISSEDLLTAAGLLSDLNTYVSTTVLSWIHGQSELNDETWQAYVDTCYEMNLQDILDIYQDGYDAFMAE